MRWWLVHLVYHRLGPWRVAFIDHIPVWAYYEGSPVEPEFPQSWEDPEDDED